MKKLKVKQYPKKQVIEIEGIQYTYLIFQGLGHNFNLNTPMMIIERKDKTVTITDDVKCPKCGSRLE